MLKEKKAQSIEHLQDIFSRSNISILADYRGLKMVELTNLRRKLGDAKIDFEVVKNTLARIALEKAGNTEASKLFEGPVVLVTGFDDVVEPARILQGHITEAKLNMAIKGGFMKSKLLSSDEVVALSKLPSKDILIARVVGGIQAPLYGLVSCLSSPMQGLLTVLQGRITQLEAK